MRYETKTGAKIINFAQSCNGLRKPFFCFWPKHNICKECPFIYKNWTELRIRQAWTNLNDVSL